MKKLMILFAIMLISAPCFAGGIGYINYEKVAANYIFAKNSLKEIETKAMEIEQFLISKEAEFKKIESPLQKQKFEETVRAEMNYLEEVGLLEKTHISSGRVPSEKGYRYYVDNIMMPRELNGEDMLKLQTIVENKSLVVNDIILQSEEIKTMIGRGEHPVNLPFVRICENGFDASLFIF